MNVTFRQLRVFIVVAEHGSMLAAAATLRLTRPAISMQIKELERNAGLSLFTRHKRRLSLSPAGGHFLVHAKKLVSELKEAENTIARFKELNHGTLRIGIHATGEYFVPRLLAIFRHSHPSVDVKIRAATKLEQLYKFMKCGEVDLCFMARLSAEVAARSDKFAGNPYVFICPPQHPLWGNRRVTFEALGRYPIIVRETGSGTRVAMERFFARHRYAPNIGMEIESNEAIKQSVMAGMGLGFLSLHSIGLELRNGLLGLVRLVDTPVMGAWNLVQVESMASSSAAKAFRDFVLNQGEKLIRAHTATLLGFASAKKLASPHRITPKARGRAANARR